MAAVDASAEAEDAVSPKDKTTMEQDMPQPPLSAINNPLNSLQMRADPDAQATVTDFLDFTEYLPSDMMRSLTLIGQLDSRYHDASLDVHNMTTTWGQLPKIPAETRPAPSQLRADISDGLNRTVSSRAFAHAEAMRMDENVNRHYNRVKLILSKLQTMFENYPTEDEQKSPVAVAKSPQLARAPKPTLRLANGEKARRQMIPRITVPGEVLAPYDNFEAYSSDSDESSDDEDVEIAPYKAGAASNARVKLMKPPKTPKPQKTPKAPGSRPPKSAGGAGSAIAPPATPLPPPKKPPENAVIGSADAPWLQLTAWELAKLRKRMKKNAQWTPSDTMISRELNDLGRGIDAYREAKRKAEEEGIAFDPAPSAIAAESENGNQQTPEGALSAAALQSDEVQLSNRGMKLNEAKKLKRESLAKQAAEEAEESARLFNETARMLMTPQQPQSNSQAKASSKPPASANRSHKRKRDSATETEPPKIGEPEKAAPRPPPAKRTKTETPVPLPHLRASLSTQPLTETPVLPPVLTPGGTAVTPHSTTPVPLPVPGQDATKRTVSPALSKENGAGAGTITTVIPVKPPAETPVPAPILSPRKSTTPILPPIPQSSKRETRGDVAKKPSFSESEVSQQSAPVLPPLQLEHTDQQPEPRQLRQSSAAPSIKQSKSRSSTPGLTPGPDGTFPRARPASRGHASSQEPQPSLATDRPRRASTARNTPVPDAAAVAVAAALAARQTSKRTRRPAPGVVSTTTSGGSSAVGKRQKAPSVKRRVRPQKKSNGQQQMVEETEEVDDEGNPIDADEARYCLCDRVSFGVMISCDNTNCLKEWFHLECVGLSAIPARTTKWYCPECRVALNIGEKGEVTARGVKA
ncbi:hypothetical protein VD0001_g8537 [Verticillium dahliae]|uniref:PHD-type domain-containing protein n=1 Tax=Verticillium dahliae TaxID=27337 RepID=A0A444S2D7_VERDA|nr:hypothetical protein VD0001_g8537 [Verticillium dahliae]RXG47585.1 hypothetical protein VDGE_06532 [Verticillium dahliae]